MASLVSTSDKPGEEMFSTQHARYSLAPLPFKRGADLFSIVKCRLFGYTLTTCTCSTYVCYAYLEVLNIYIYIHIHTHLLVRILYIELCGIFPRSPLGGQFPEVQRRRCTVPCYATPGQSSDQMAELCEIFDQKAWQRDTGNRVLRK